MFERDAGQGLENFDKPPTKVNVFERASKIKTWNMFIHLAEQENITPAEALVVVLKHIRKNWTRLKILKDPQQMEAIANLLKWEDKIKRKKLLGKSFDLQKILQQQKDKGYVLTALGWKKKQE